MYGANPIKHSVVRLQIINWRTKDCDKQDLLGCEFGTNDQYKILQYCSYYNRVAMGSRHQ